MAQDLRNEEVLQGRVFPAVFGNEEETGMQCGYSGSHLDEPYALVNDIPGYLPDDVREHRNFLSNGFKIYIGGSSQSAEPTNLERATPECTTPTELKRYIRASELLLTKVAERYAILTSQDGSDVHVRIQRRVVDSRGSRKACHDNFGISSEAEMAGPHKRLAPSFLEHLATRSFVTGAGYVHTQRLRYAQKPGGLSSVEGYGYFGSMYRRAKEKGNTRVEVRCSDINISEWATHVRIGSSALVLALNETPLGAQLSDYEYSDDAILQRAKAMNNLRLQSDGTIADSTPLQIAAVDFQQTMAEMAMDKLQLYTDLPEEYFLIARELYNYCEDYRKVLAGEATIELLADRADWAAKLWAVLRDIEKDNSHGMRRKLTDWKSRARDLQYDLIGIRAVDGELHRRNTGFGYKLRDRGKLRGTTAPQAVIAAYKNPPAGTRARLRGMLIEAYEATRCDWDEVGITDGHHEAIIHLPDVMQTEMDDYELGQMELIKQRAPIKDKH